MNKGRILLVWIVVLISSCTLSTQQEMNLNKDIQQFIQIRNQGDALSYLNYIHPAIVRHYKNLGDSTFKDKFEVLPHNKNSFGSRADVIYWNQSYIKSVTKRDSLYEAKVEISLIKNSERQDSTTTFYAISTNDASNWLFVSEFDYFNVLGEEWRLFGK